MRLLLILRSVVLAISTGHRRCPIPCSPRLAGCTPWGARPAPNAAPAGLREGSASFGTADPDPSEILLHIYLKCRVGTSALHSGSCLFFFFWKGLLTTSSKSAGTLSPQHYLQSGTPNYTHYADEDALARRYALARLRIRSGSVAGMGIKLGIVATGSSPTTARPWATPRPARISRFGSCRGPPPSHLTG